MAIFGVMPLSQTMAQEHQEGHDADGSMTHYNADFDQMASKFVELAEAMPADQYSWRPMEGVRSVSEVFMLIVAENYVVPSAWGVGAPEGTPGGMEAFSTLAEVTDKAEVVRHLRESSAHFQHAVGSLDAEKMQSEIEFFGRTRSVMEAVYLIAGDMHEHLGQAIAYARMHEVVPPWTARQQANQGN